MPIPLIHDDKKLGIAAELRRIAGLIDKIGPGDNPARNYRQLTTIQNRLERIGNVLEKGVSARHVTSAQLRSIASGFEAIGAALRKL